MAIYECHKCEREEFVPRRFRYHLGPACRCPVCGSYRVTRLKEPDRIDRFHGGFLNVLERIASGGKLVHCRWCRIQFYDRRPLSNDLSKAPAGADTGEARPEEISEPVQNAANPAKPA